MNTPQTFDFQSGPDLSGYWKNYKTGQIVRIKDTIFEDNNLVGVTYDGQMVNMNKLKDFVKYNPTTDETTQLSNPAQTKSTDQSVLLRGLNTDTTQKPEVVDSSNSITDEYIPYDYTQKYEPKFQLKRGDESCSCNSISDPDRAAIIKVLDNLDEKDKPKITVKLDWVIPDGVKFLQDYLHITPAQIAEVVKERYADLTVLNDAVTDEILRVLGAMAEVKISAKTSAKTSVKTEEKPLLKTEEISKQQKAVKQTKK